MAALSTSTTSQMNKDSEFYFFAFITGIAIVNSSPHQRNKWPKY